MAVPVQASARNRLLAALSPADFSLLEPQLEPIPLPVRTCLAEPNRPVEHVYFLDEGIASVVASTPLRGPERARGGQMRQGPTEPSDRLALRQARTWVVLGLSVAFLLIGALFILAPRWGAALFGIPAPDDRGLAYVRAIGFRDLALALYIVGLTLFSSRRALSTVLALTVLIPVCDVALVASMMGLSSPGHLALHGVSAICFALLAVWVRRDQS